MCHSAGFDNDPQQASKHFSGDCNIEGLEQDP